MPPSDEPAVENTAPGPSQKVAARSGERVLLLEDDEAFREIIGEFFTENGYAVTSVKSGGDALKEIQTADFSIILCDMILPDLHGDLFYRAIERSRPQLCDRFVFMTGHAADASIGDFIKEVNGCVLLKPFQLQDLLDLVQAIETRRKFAKWRGRATTDKSIVGALRNRERELPPPPPVALAAAPSEPASVEVRPIPQPVIIHAAPERRWLSFSPIFWTTLWAVSLLALVAVSGGRYFDLRARVAGLSVEVQEAQKQWAATSAQLQEAENGRRPDETLVSRVRRLTEERDAPRLSLALRSVSRAVGANETLRDIRAYEDPAAPGACNLRITGSCIGRDPRTTADRFRQVIEANLKPYFGGERVTARFGRLDEEPASAAEPSGAQQQKASFTIIAATASKQSAAEKSRKR